MKKLKYSYLNELTNVYLSKASEYLRMNIKKWYCSKRPTSWPANQSLHPWHILLAQTEKKKTDLLRRRFSLAAQTGFDTRKKKQKKKTH